MTYLFTGFKEEIKSDNLYFCLKSPTVVAGRTGYINLIHPPSYPRNDFDVTISIGGPVRDIRDSVPFLSPDSNSSTQNEGIKLVNRGSLEWFCQNNIFVKLFRKIFGTQYTRIEKLEVTYIFNKTIEKKQTFYVTQESSENYWSRFSSQENNWNNGLDMNISCEYSNGCRKVGLIRLSDHFISKK